MPSNEFAPLPRFWRRLFLVELPLVLSALGLWLAAPTTYLRDTVGIAQPGPPEVLLLRLYAGTVGSLVLGFYGWLLLQRSVHLPTFRAFQVCLGVGDLAIFAAGVAHWPATDRHDLLAVQMGMAALWGVVRSVYVLRVG